MTEAQIRLSIFLGMLILMSAIEAFFPAKSRTQSRGRRWTTNLGLVVIDTLAIRLLFPVIAVGAALWAESRGWGLLNVLALPLWVKVIAAVIILDMLIYWQHVAFHKIPIFWRLHKVHHADRDLDASSGLRFHPVEIVLSMVLKMAAVVALGAPVVAVIIFEIILNACAIFNHANVRLPRWLERPLRLVIITPALHRIHHSVREVETNSNYGFSVIWWDRLFGSFTAKPKGILTLGLNEYQDDAPSGLLWSLMTPFRRAAPRN
ncbi:fatty acid hydroxylase [Litorimonas cladophorae]|uniref:Fatty acid hydroxylase n=1 Tax=Litorimonas cladophorae TaxID=1220491 RepID=A0A918KS09_9PROT|nr:sterol desaturase family protein [Litorimonas cladophorae]GGX73766.1 fatty acid hydroxylase [Litorimonas cladophorae]